MKSRSHIVFITISAELGGAERSLIDLAQSAQRHNDVPPIVLLPRSGPLEEQLRLRGIATQTLRVPRLYESVSRKNIFSFLLFALFGVPAALTYYFKLNRWLRKTNPYAVHSTGIKNHIVCCLLSLHTPWHFYVHIRDYIKSPLMVWFLKFFSKAKNIHWMSASKAIVHNLPWPIPVFYDGLDSSVFFKNRTGTLKQNLGLKESTLLIGHAAALTPWKGQILFIEAASLLLKKNPDWHFVIIGSPIYKTNHDTNYEQSLKDKALELQIEHRIHFLPFIKNSREIYDGIDAFVHCSLEPEPFGRVIVESLFCEVPTVAAKAGGVLEILSDLEAENFLHTPNDKNSLAIAIENALSISPKQLEALSQNIKTRFNGEDCYKRQVDYLYQPH